MFTQAYIDTALYLLQHYPGGEPFHLYLKRYYGVHKKFGSRDRRFITQLCYSWFRAGHAVKHLDKKAQLVYALFLCSDGETTLLERLDATLNQVAAKSLDEKIALLQKQIGFDVQLLFPWNKVLSSEIDPEHFDRSLLIQPNLFLRLRPGREQKVINALQQQHIAFETISETCIATSNSTKADAVLKLDADVVVQDRNSQQVLTLLNGQHGLLKKFSVWDCCAASGGKSLLLLDQYPGAQLTVSDVRQNIIHNLQVRFKNAGIRNYNAFIANAATDAPPHRQKFDLIICDAPCSGSGTWSRTPEQLHFHTSEKTTAYVQLQKSIVRNVARYLKPGGLLLYCTCSVFAEENEAVVTFIKENSPVNFLKSTYFKGYDHKADTLFAALFQAL